MSAAPSPPPELLEAWSERMLDTAPGERAALRDELAARHPEFRAALSRLFQRIGGVDRLLEVSYALPPAATDPLSIAGHRVLRRLGQGAFGTVFLCQQEHPVSRQVAIKVARGAVDPELLRRFHVERQLLASLSHPSIAQIYDAGQLPDGLPYFVMEFVDGSPFTDLCVKRRLDTGQRLRLFADLCRGIDHAHRRGVVHRDLKPGNVLLVELDGALQPKIIDFGIAKALTPPDDGEARTDTGRVMGTPGYMSPEQAGGRSDLVDARTDVFALGVMLYELLTGDLPWPRGALRETDTEPARPSVRITRDSRQDPGDGGGRRLAARVRGDLDWITL
ncbi:MAG: serine/threonine protein kinase, partial [Planctomycetes bacterium]|nr:serine/threonine protein kinase [Planctomycetota bacterium]